MFSLRILDSTRFPGTVLFGSADVPVARARCVGNLGCEYVCVYLLPASFLGVACSGIVRFRRAFVLRPQRLPSRGANSCRGNIAPKLGDHEKESFRICELRCSRNRVREVADRTHNRGVYFSPMIGRFKFHWAITTRLITYI